MKNALINMDLNNKNKSNLKSLLSLKINIPPSLKTNATKLNGDSIKTNSSKKCINFNITFEDKEAFIRKVENDQNKKSFKKNTLSNLFSTLENPTKKSFKRKNLFGSELEDISEELNLSDDLKPFKKIIELQKKYPRLEDLPRIDENRHDPNLEIAIDYLKKVNKHYLNNPLISKIENKFKQASFVNDIMRLSSISDSFAVSPKLNSKNVGKDLILNQIYELEEQSNPNSVNTQTNDDHTNNGNNLNIFEENSDILSTLINTNQVFNNHIFNSIDLNNNNVILPQQTTQQENIHEPDLDIIISPLFINDPRYEHYISKMTLVILNSLKRIYNLNLEQLEYLIANYKIEEDEEKGSVVENKFLKSYISKMSDKLKNLIRDYESLNFELNKDQSRPGVMNMGHALMNFFKIQINYYVFKKSSQIIDTKFLKDFIDLYHSIKFQYDIFCIRDLNFKLGSGFIDTNQTSNLMSYLNDYKSFLDDVLSDLLASTKMDVKVNSKIRSILQNQIIFVPMEKIFDAEPLDPRSKDKVYKSVLLKNIKFDENLKTRPIAPFNEKSHRKNKYKNYSMLQILSKDKWNICHDRIKSIDVIDFEEMSETTFTSIDMVSDLDLSQYSEPRLSQEMNRTQTIPVSDEIRRNQLLSNSSVNSVPRTPIYRPNQSDMSENLSVLEPRNQSLIEDIQSVPITPVFHTNLSILLESKNALIESTDVNMLEEFDNKADFNEEILQREILKYVINPLINKIEGLFF